MSPHGWNSQTFSFSPPHGFPCVDHMFPPKFLLVVNAPFGTHVVGSHPRETAPHPVWSPKCTFYILLTLFTFVAESRALVTQDRNEMGLSHRWFSFHFRIHIQVHLLSIA